MKILILKSLFFVLLPLALLIRCNDDEPVTGGNTNDTTTNDTIVPDDFKVNITSASNHRGIKAYIFLNDSLFGKTNQNGNFFIKTLKSGNYRLIISAVNYRDTSLEIIKTDSNVLSYEFILKEETTTGSIYGEFQDMFLLRQKMLEKPEIKTWNEKAIFDGVTGATMQKKSYTSLPVRQVSVNNENYKTSDEFGQYWFDIQCGTYKLAGSCDGYRTSTDTIINVLPGAKIYLNFYLERN